MGTRTRRQEAALSQQSGERHHAAVWSGDRWALAITFRHKANNMDLSGLSRIRWSTKTSGFHVVRPVVKLTDGTMLVKDYTDMCRWLRRRSSALSGLRWMRQSGARVVTVAPGNSNPTGTVLGANETWVVNPDLTKVEEFGFADLMPSSGQPGWLYSVGEH